VKGSILTLNAGSSSLKIALFPPGDESPIATGSAERIGGDCTLTIKDASGAFIAEHKGDAMRGATHETVLRKLIHILQQAGLAQNLVAIGHRVVHGGTDFVAPILVDDAALNQLVSLEPLAPLHQPHNLAGIRAARSAFPDVLQIACFDTAFHRNHPFVNDTFALPLTLYAEGIRRYGFHGLSYEYVTQKLAAIRPELHAGRVIICHLGNGASACAIRDGQSIASTMGFSALDGLPMGTRCGQLDPGVILYLLQQKKMNADAIADLLYNQSGLLGLSGLSNDMRVLEASDDPAAKAAIDYFVFRIRREIGGLAASLGGLDALIFCGGIGENSCLIRARVCDDMAWMGIAIDPQRNAAHETILSAPLSPVEVMMIPTQEDIVIARAANAMMEQVQAQRLRAIGGIPPL
jgi:acetate kinase